MPVTLPAPELAPGLRSALVIAIGAYADHRLGVLRAPARDARDFAAVLGEPLVGGFTVTELRNRVVQDLRLEVEGFLADRVAEETVLVYVSCHGVLSARRRLYFAASDTDMGRLAATGLDSRWLIECLDECRARRQVVILDCCFSGAFALAKGVKGPAEVGLEDLFGEAGESRGRVVLTASRATEYSFEGEALATEGAPGSVFTTALLEGLRTGAADADHDGFVSVAEAYAYAYARVRESNGAQTPQRWLYGGEGVEVILARSPAGITIEPAALHDEVRAGLDSRFPRVRLGAVETLSEWLTDRDIARVIAARAFMTEIAEHDIPLVAQAARAYLDRHLVLAVRLPPARLDLTPNQTPISLSHLRPGTTATEIAELCVRAIRNKVDPQDLRQILAKSGAVSSGRLALDILEELLRGLFTPSVDPQDATDWLRWFTIWFADGTFGTEAAKEFRGLAIEAAVDEIWHRLDTLYIAATGGQEDASAALRDVDKEYLETVVRSINVILRECNKRPGRLRSNPFQARKDDRE